MTRNRFNYFLLLCLILFFPLQLFAAGDNESAVLQQYRAWCKSLGTAKGDAEQVVKFYAPNAILLPTLSSEILVNNNGGLNAYFASLTSRDQFKCTPEKFMIQMYGPVAINSGTYTFSYLDKAGHLKKVPARFTFVYQNNDNVWKIVNHHSSVLP